MSSSRQLAAIMFTDIVGYTALMGHDEEKAFELLRKNRNIQKPLIKHYKGTWIKELGDGVLASFHTLTDAVFCAAAIHHASSKVHGLQLRIGIHLGEVIFENNDVFGDGVNIASRLQAMASPGRTWVSEAVYKNLLNKKEITAEFVKEETLKNVSEPVKVYEITVKEIPEDLPDNLKIFQKQGKTTKTVESKTILTVGIVLSTGLIISYFLFFNKSPSPAMAGRVAYEKSIAVIPFKNLSDEKSNQYFADGMMDEILNKLSKIKDLKVIARTSVEQYRDTKKPIREIAKELGVNYVLEGSAQKYGDQIKVIAQLIFAETEDHLWANDYMKNFKEVFAVQTEIANKIVDELQAKLSPLENELVNKAATANSEAYDFYLRGREFITSYESNSNERELAYARDMFVKALQIEGNFAQAWVGLGLEYEQRNQNSPEFFEERFLDSVLFFCNKAISIDANLADAYEIRGRYYIARKNNDKAIEDAQKAISINPNHALAYWTLGQSYFNKHDYLKSLFNFKKTRDLITSGSRLPILLNLIAGVHVTIGNFEEAEALHNKAIQLNPGYANGYVSFAWCQYVQGRFDKALGYFQKSVEINPEANEFMGHLANTYAYLNDFTNAYKFFQKAEELRKKTGDIRINTVHREGYILWNIDKKEEAVNYFNDQLKRIEDGKKLGRQMSSAYDQAAIYAFLGQEKKAIYYLKECEKENFGFALEYFIMHDPLFEKLRSNKEFKEIIDRAQARKMEIRRQVKELEAKGEL